MKATLCIDDAVGEHRRALLDPFGKPFRLEIERWAERGARTKLDETWWGRITARMPGGGWFVDLGLSSAGVVEPSKAQAIVEGAMLPLRVKSEAWGDKGPVLSLADMSPSASRPDRPARHAPPTDDPFLRGVEVIATLMEKPARAPIDAAIEETGQRVVSIDGGGDLAIDTARALTAIDVDAGDRNGAADIDTFRIELNLAAAEEAARQISLRNIGGLVAIDFVGMQQRRHQKEVVAAYRNALAGWLGRSSQVLEMSELGVCEAAIARRARPVADTASPEEREALDALRNVESAGWSARGSRIHALLSRAAKGWLEARPDLATSLNDRIGARWTVEAEDRAPGRAKVWSAS
ncbi:MAG TPA: ribonuclease E/G [Hyphomonadaceae bacterium]|nr:ribonuclease E/G [Hyphomonadaceae bacterium]